MTPLFPTAVRSMFFEEPVVPKGKSSLIGNLVQGGLAGIPLVFGGLAIAESFEEEKPGKALFGVIAMATGLFVWSFDSVREEPAHPHNSWFFWRTDHHSSSWNHFDSPRWSWSSPRRGRRRIVSSPFASVSRQLPGTSRSNWTAPIADFSSWTPNSGSVSNWTPSPPSFSSDVATTAMRSLPGIDANR